MLDVRNQVKPTGACFYGAGMVLAALDAFATFLTGQRYYLASIDGSGFIVPEAVEEAEVSDVQRLGPDTRETADGD